MNWYKKSQIEQQYQELIDQRVAAIQITGSGQNESVTIPGFGQTIQARTLLENVKQKIGSILLQNNVKEINTDPIPQASAQGLAISHEPGIIHVDVRKIFEQANTQMPSIVQTDGITIDPDIATSFVDHVSNMLEAELVETASHESQHVVDYIGAYEKGDPFTSVQESPAQQFGERTRRQYFPQNY
tara:strand:+ start:319 stop:876 length:558 start_codon:yes stop_codon:yes gene_type:complete